MGPQAEAGSGIRSRPTTRVQTITTTSNGTVRNDDRQAVLLDLLRAVRDWAEYQQSTGVRWLPARPLVGACPPADARDEQPAAPVRMSENTESSAAPFVAPDLRGAGSLDELRAHIGDCRRCKLWSGRTNLVFGVGHPNAKLMFVGEGPGRDEDLRGEPFVGRAGQLLTEIISKGMKLQRSEVYIANVVKCRPPENRNPEPDEIARCLPYLARQVELVQPQVIVALGTFAAQTLLGVRTPISRLRGIWHEYRGIKLMPTLHPAYLLRNPADKRLVWEDIKQVMKHLGLPV